jgi:selenocysteine lyase/cysteine desulfurase
MGATFDPSGLYRFNAVMRWLKDEGITPAAVHAHAAALQQSFLRRVAGSAMFRSAALTPPAGETRRGNFLTFDMANAQAIHRDLHELRVVTDVRGQRLRLGFGLYQTDEEVDDLVRRIDEAGALESLPAPQASR